MKIKPYMRTHTCGEIREGDRGKDVLLNGWVQSRRDHGGLIFIDLRDRYGLTQIVFDPSNKEAFSTADKLRREDVLEIKGKVRARKEGMENPKLDTGKIEVLVSDIKVINKAETPPLEVDDRVEANEEIRLKYRYIDLRRPIMQHRLAFRHNVVSTAREYFNKHNFLEIETPLLVKSTPEGARDYVVPSRVNIGKFYALPQSPQLYKQILMVSGCDRYYQIARCLRDEDLRADRQPEHTQFDLEMSFVTSDEIREFVEGLYKYIFDKVLGVKLKDFLVLSYKECMDKYGTDKPDIRFKLFLTDVSSVISDSDFQVFKDVIKNGGIVKCVCPSADFGRKELDDLIEFCTSNGAKGMAWLKVTDKGIEGNIAKYFSDEVKLKLLEKTKAKSGSAIMFIADKPKMCNEILSKLRVELARRMKLIKENDFKFCWVTDFPLFAYNEEEGRWEPEHHMFTMPKEEFISDFESRPGEVIGDLYDIVLNGVEMGSGSIRVTNPELQERIMKFIGLSKEDANKKFGFLLDAYRYGGPNHGGMGLGVDRLVAMMMGMNDIREVIAFPKNKNAECPMDGCPSNIDDKQMRELHIKLDVVKKKE